MDRRALIVRIGDITSGRAACEQADGGVARAVGVGVGVEGDAVDRLALGARAVAVVVDRDVRAGLDRAGVDRRVRIVAVGAVGGWHVAR